MEKTKPKFDPEKLKAIQAKYKISDTAFHLVVTRCCAEARDEDDVDLFCYKCVTLKLDPLLDQIHYVARKKNKQVDGQWVEVLDVPTMQVGIDALRTFADRSLEYCGSDAPVFHYIVEQGDPSIGKPTVVNSGPVWIPGTILVAVTLTVWRAKDKDPKNKAAYSQTVYLRDYCQTKRDGSPTKMWTKIGIMLPKCSEAGALRKGFPVECGGMYAPEEMMASADEPEPEKEEKKPVSVVEAAEAKSEPLKPAPMPDDAPKTPAPALEAQEVKKEAKKEEKAPVLDTRAKATKIVEAIKDHFKEKAGPALKLYIAICAGKERYEDVLPGTREVSISLLYGSLKKEGGEALAKKIEEFIAAGGKQV